MRRVAGSALTVAAAFLSLMAVLIDAPSLFYMSFALIATIGAAHIQSSLASRSLRIERIVPEAVVAGDLATVELILWSQRRIKRPLVTVLDDLPARMFAVDLTPSLPVAPSFDQPIRTQYRFRPLKRGRYRLSRTFVTATDALGLIVKTVPYDTPPAEIIVTPRPLPVELELPSGAGFGSSEAESGSIRGAGIEPRGLRAYTTGDSLRYVDWRSSARTGTLQVKEFEAGTHGQVVFVLQRSPAIDGAGVPMSAFDAMCGHALYLAAGLLRAGVRVTFTDFESPGTVLSEGERLDSIALTLGAAVVDPETTLTGQVQNALEVGANGATLILMVGADDGTLEDAVRLARSSGDPAVLTYDPLLFDPAFRGVTAGADGRDENLRRAGASVHPMPYVNIMESIG